jgi:hypothetical protein
MSEFNGEIDRKLMIEKIYLLLEDNLETNHKAFQRLQLLEPFLHELDILVATNDLIPKFKYQYLLIESKDDLEIILKSHQLLLEVSFAKDPSHLQECFRYIQHKESLGNDIPLQEQEYLFHIQY